MPRPKTYDEPRESLTLRLDPALAARLRANAEIAGVSVNRLVETLVVESLNGPGGVRPRLAPPVDRIANPAIPAPVIPRVSPQLAQPAEDATVVARAVPPALVTRPGPAPWLAESVDDEEHRP